MASCHEEQMWAVQDGWLSSEVLQGSEVSSESCLNVLGPFGGQYYLGGELRQTTYTSHFPGLSVCKGLVNQCLAGI